MTMVLFYFIGDLAKREVKRAVAMQKISVLDLDRSDLSGGLLNNLKVDEF